MTTKLPVGLYGSKQREFTPGDKLDQAVLPTTYHTLSSPAVVYVSPADTLVDITDLSFDVVAGKNYAVRLFAWFTTQANTVGTRWVFSGASATVRGTSLVTRNVTAATLALIDGHLTPTTFTTASVAGGGVAELNVIITALATGTITPQASGNKVNQHITVQPGSYIEITELP